MIALVYKKNPKYNGQQNILIFRYHYIQDVITQVNVFLKYISTIGMVADPLSRAIARDTF